MNNGAQRTRDHADDHLKAAVFGHDRLEQAKGLVVARAVVELDVHDDGVAREANRCGVALHVLAVDRDDDARHALIKVDAKLERLLHRLRATSAQTRADSRAHTLGGATNLCTPTVQPSM